MKVNKIFYLFLILAISLLYIPHIYALRYEGEFIKSEEIPDIYYYKHRSDTDDIKYTTHNFHEKAYVYRRSTDGNVVYCIQSWKHITGSVGNDYEVFDGNTPATGLTDEEFEKIKEIAYFGFGFHNEKYDHTDLKWYAITQKLIWDVQAPEIDHYLVDSINGVESDAFDFIKEEKEILSLVKKYNEGLNFEKIEKKIKFGETRKILDKNGNLDNFEITSRRRYLETVKDTNYLTITANEIGVEPIFLTQTLDRTKKQVQVYISNDYQNLLSVGDLETKEYRFYIEVEGYLLTINKETNTIDKISLYNDEVIYQEKKSPINGVVFELYANEKIYDGMGFLKYKKNQLVDTIETGVNNTCIQLYPGKYYFYETSVPDGYIKSDERYYITVSKYEETVDIINEHQKLNINFKKMYEYQENLFTLKKDVQFNLYANNDIFNDEHSLIAKKGDIVASFKTDELGLADITLNLPYGLYHLEEQKVDDYHENFMFDFEFKYDGTNQEIQYININKNNLIINYLKNNNLIIKKVDTLTDEPIEGVEFTLYNKDKKIINTYLTNQEGIINLNMKAGKYFLQETKTLTGYIIDDNIYEIDLTEDKEIKLTNNKELVIQVKVPATELNEYYYLEYIIIGISICLKKLLFL